MAGKAIDLTGKIFGKWSVIKRAGSHINRNALWLCRCSCGSAPKKVSGYDLRVGRSTNCGCSRFEDLTGAKFGRLVVLKRVSAKKQRGHWLCECACGNVKVVPAANLKNGSTKSCGCLVSEGNNKLSAGESSFNLLYCCYKGSAVKRGYEFRLTKKEFSHLTKQDCYWCGAAPSSVKYKGGYNGKYVYNGVDRLDNTSGYVIRNTVACCKRCNYAKHSLSIEDFLDMVSKIYKKHLAG